MTQYYCSNKNCRWTFIILSTCVAISLYTLLSNRENLVEILQLEPYEGIASPEFLNSSMVTADNPSLIRIIRQQFLIPPSSLPYNFKEKSFTSNDYNPSAGQVQVVQDILRGFGPDAFFLEAGANDGEWYSNTVWLERHLGWSGLLIEADPNIFPILRSKNRKVRTGHFCLADTRHPKTISFYLDPSGGLGSGLIKSDRYNAVTPVTVQCFPLYSVLLAVNRLTVDFFSLDIEGSELDILDTVPFHLVTFKVITIEVQYLKEGKAGLRRYMEARGYIFFQTVIKIGWGAADVVFIHNSVELTPAQRARVGAVDDDIPDYIKPRNVKNN